MYGLFIDDIDVYWPLAAWHATLYHIIYCNLFPRYWMPAIESLVDNLVRDNLSAETNLLITPQKASKLPE